MALDSKTGHLRGEGACLGMQQMSGHRANSIKELHYTVDYRKSTHQSTSAANNCCRSLMDLVSRHRSSTPYTYTSGTDSPRTERQPQRLQLTSTDVSYDDKTICKQQQQQQHLS